MIDTRGFYIDYQLICPFCRKSWYVRFFDFVGLIRITVTCECSEVYENDTVIRGTK